MNNNYMDEQTAIDLIAEFARIQTTIAHQANSGTGKITKKAIATEKKLSERILRGLTGRELNGSLKNELTMRLGQ